MKEENLKKNRNETLKKKKVNPKQKKISQFHNTEKKKTNRFCSLVKSQTSRVLVPEELAGLTCDCSDTIWRTVRRSCDRPAGSRAPRASPPPAWCSLVPLGVAAAAAEPCIGRIYCGLCADAATHTCMDTHARARAYAYTRINIHAACTYTHIRIHTTCIYTHTHAHSMYIHTYTHARTHTHASVHIHMRRITHTVIHTLHVEKHRPTNILS